MSCSVSPEDRLEIRRLSLVNVMAQTGQKPACFVAPANYRPRDDDLAGLASRGSGSQPPPVRPRSHGRAQPGQIAAFRAAAWFERSALMPLCNNQQGLPPETLCTAIDVGAWLLVSAIASRPVECCHGKSRSDPRPSKSRAQTIDRRRAKRSAFLPGER
jgi:hypothetical protein